MKTLKVAVLGTGSFETLLPTIDPRRDVAIGLFDTLLRPAFFHGGHDDGLEHFTVCYRKSWIGVVILTNSSNGEAAVEEILKAAIGDAFAPVEWLGFRPE